ENDEGVAVTRWPRGFFRLHRKAQRVGSGGRAARLQGAKLAKRNPWGAYGSAEIHQRLREVTGPGRNRYLNRVADQWLGVADRLLEGAVGGDDAVDIAVDHGDALVTGNRRDGRTCVWTDAGKR